MPGSPRPATETLEPTALALPPEELRALVALGRLVDDLLEESLRERENLALTFARSFPEWLAAVGAHAVVVQTRDEALEPQTFAHGDFSGLRPEELLQRFPHGVHRLVGAHPGEHPGGHSKERVFVSQPLDVAGARVGAIGLLYPDTGRASEVLCREVDAIAEELDSVLMTLHTAAEKQQLVVAMNERLANPVFEQGMDAAVATLARTVRFPGLVLVFRDAVQPSVLRYRSYVDGRLEYESGRTPWPALEAAIAREGQDVISPANQIVREVTGGHRATEAVLIPGSPQGDSLGKIVAIAGPGGFSTFGLDLIRVLAASLTQRLLDYNRERIHLSQFFEGGVIDELLRDPDYARKHLSPRVEEVAILFADLNGFTRICERVLESPAKIGDFVDRWSVGAVEILHRHGGVFDKMVGDCVIGLFGPPFFRGSAQARAEAAVRAALEIQRFTVAMSSDSELARIGLAELSGLGVAAGVNLAPTCCGLFGPNHAYTGFSTGMNQTARLQALGTFRQILLMEPVRALISRSEDPQLRALRFGPLTETPVKNVEQPLRHAELLLD